MTQYFEDFKNKLQEMFMTDTDLDFGIYRIMKAKHVEIETFIDTDLKKTVDDALAQGGKGDKQDIKKQMKEIELRMGNVDIHTLPEAIPDVKKYLELEKQLGNSVDIADLEDDVYSRLTDFFSRYYDNGDFVRNRRYSSDGRSYVIPNDGEEVKLYWSNSDQYYIKTSENFQNYRFNAGGYAIRFELVNINTEQNNNKSTEDKKRTFMLYSEVKKKDDGIGEDTPDVETFEIAEVTDAQEGMPAKEFIVRFVYDIPSLKKETVIDPKTGKEKEQDIDWTEKAYAAIMAFLKDNEKDLMYELHSTYKTSKKDVLRHHLDSYVGKNSFDYFIHKDLGGFLRFELDYYIKNEVLLLQDLDIDTVSTHLNVAKAIKAIGEKVITFLAQIEDFQKKLWLKKKFVLQSNYCITLDRVPTSFYPEIAANEKQRKEWVRLFAIDKIKGDLMRDGYSEPLTIKFLEDNQYLVLDTAFFPLSFKHRLETAMQDVDENINGLLINSENFQALELLQEKYAWSVKCVYIDPPYNTGDDDFAYKDNFKESSWLCCIDNRIELTQRFYKEFGSFTASIDINELDKITMLLDNALGKENRKANITVRRASITGAKVINPGPVNISENVIVYSNGVNKWKPENAYRERDYDNRYGNIILNPQDHFEKWTFGTVLEEFAKEKGVQKSKLNKALGDSYNDELLKFVIKNGDRIVQFATLDDNSVGAGASELKKKSLAEPTKIFYLKREDVNDYYVTKGKVILFYKDRLRWMGDGIAPVEKVSDIWDDVLPNDLHNEGGVQLKKGKKPEKLINRIFESTTKEGELILDYFAGSATSGAVALKSNRRFINVEANVYFRDIPLRRLKNTLAGDKSGVTKLYQWKGGGCFKYLRLEQYEDTLNNLSLVQPTSAGLFNDENFSNFREGYLLHYMLDTETRGSLFNLEWFTNPFNMRLMASEDNELVETQVDLVETFNYLIGLEVESIRWNEDESICAVVGKKHIGGDKVLVLWRNGTMVDNDQLNAYFVAQCKGIEGLDTIYANGNSLLGTMKAKSDHWTVELTEAEFMNKMFNLEEAE